jgi:predicted NBD/HSP70 family sugar kinase
LVQTLDELTESMLLLVLRQRLAKLGSDTHMSHTVRRIVRDLRSSGTLSGGHHSPLKSATDLHGLREANRRRVLNHIRSMGPVARVAIAERIGLSRTTVGGIVDALLKEGFVREGSALSAAPNGGRRAILVHFNESAGHILAADMGRSHLTLLVTDLAANILARFSGPFDCELGAEVCLPVLVEKIRSFAAAWSISWDSVIGLGLGIPGPMDARQRMLVSPPRMPGWHGVDIHRYLQRELKVPIFIGNDANMGALGESRLGAGRGVSDFAYVKLATGIGCGLVIGGNVYRGSRGTAGELGHVTIDEDGPLCDCGNRGCLETLASAPLIVDDALHATSLRRNLQQQAAAMGQDEPPDIDLQYSPSPLLAHGGHIEVADVVLAALDNDPASLAAIQRSGELIGIGLASLVNLFNPSLILLDGNVTRADRLVFEPIEKALRARSLSAASQHLRIARGELEDNAVALGAVACVIDAAFGRPELPSGSLAPAPAGALVESHVSSSSSRTPETE